MCDDFFERLEILSKNDVTVILREKDLNENEYKKLAEKAAVICPDIILHTYSKVALRLGVRKIHIPFVFLKEIKRSDFDVIGVSVHSVAEAIMAEQMGVNYIVAGHIYTTNCKKGLEPRGLEFLRNIVESVKIPVYGIGGITADNIAEICEIGADGGCIMSGFMENENITEYLQEINKNLLKK